MAIMVYGIFISGARSALIMLCLSLLIAVWRSRKTMLPFVVVLLCIGGYQLVTGGDDPITGDRFHRLFEKGAVWGRFATPFVATWNQFTDSPMGYGLGSSSLGIPFFMMEKLTSNNTAFHMAEGDLPCLVTDMGLLGIIFFLSMIGSALVMVVRSVGQLKDTQAHPLAIGCLSILVPTIIACPLGSPFLGIPSGPMVWFFLGTIQKISSFPGDAGVEPTPGRPPGVAGKKLFYHRPDTPVDEPEKFHRHRGA